MCDKNSAAHIDKVCRGPPNHFPYDGLGGPLLSNPGPMCSQVEIQEADEWLYGRAGYLHGCLFFQAPTVGFSTSVQVTIGPC